MYIPYKEIEPFYEYKNNDVIQLHNDILQIMNLLHREYLHRELKSIEYNNTDGLTVDNFIQTLNFENNNFKEKIYLYVNYLQFYHKLQNNHLNSIFTRISLFINEINEQLISNNNINSKEQNDEYKNNIKIYLDEFEHSHEEKKPEEKESEEPEEKESEEPEEKESEEPEEKESEEPEEKN